MSNLIDRDEALKAISEIFEKCQLGSDASWKVDEVIKTLKKLPLQQQGGNEKIMTIGDECQFSNDGLTWIKGIFYGYASGKYTHYNFISRILPPPPQSQGGNEKIKELIEKKIEENNRKSYKDWGDTSNDILQELLSEIDNLPPQSQWIPVSERLPENLKHIGGKTTFVYVYCYGKVIKAQFHNVFFIDDADEGQSDIYPTHWMYREELPLPPNN